MRIDLNSIDRENFQVDEHIIILNGETVHLVQPNRAGVEWNRENRLFRSSLWNWNGDLISAGFPKFVNWGEQPEHFPVPQSLKGCQILEKIDGSLLIVSKYNGQLIIRTRGTIDASGLEKNGNEIEIFRNQLLPRIVEYHYGQQTWNCSWLFEWTSPNQRIVLSYGDQPRWTLVGLVDHNDYRLARQPDLDQLAANIGFNRPQLYTSDTVEGLLNKVDTWKGIEGVCVYSNDGQSIHKIKSTDYLIKHRFKSKATLENTLELFFNYGQPPYQNFEKELIQQFDYECFEMVRGYASSICDASKKVSQIIGGIVRFVEPLKLLPRKNSAEAILSSYGSSGRSNIAFTILDGKPVDENQTKKVYWQVLKK